VLLRDVTEGDLPLFFEHQLDPDAIQMAAFAPRDRETFMAHWTKILGDDTITKKTILFHGQVAGNLVKFEHSGKQELGYWIDKNYWGKGVATRALSEFLVHVKARPLYASVAAHNIGSLRVLEKCGFTIVGEDREFSSAGGKKVEGIVLKLGEDETDSRSLPLSTDSA
jgi:RimJ/RimL family protein N-acetyltransferase